MSFTKTILKNGLRVILVPQPSSLAATVLILVEAGSEYEAKSVNGVSHFLEHMTFKGTARRPRPGMIAEELAGLGAESNAFTSHEYTGYWAKAEREKLPQILDIVSDLYLSPLFNPEEIEKERGVVIEEVNMYEDTPTQRVHSLFMRLLYGDQPAGWDILGEKRTIRKLGKKDLVAYREKHYIAPKTVVVVAGSLSPKRVMGQVKEMFGGLKRARTAEKLRTAHSQRKPRAIVKVKESDKSHLVLGVPAFTVFDKRRYALQVLSDVLGGGMSSRLFHRLREELGAAYYIHASAEFLIDHGYLGVGAGVDHKKLEMVLKAILEELERLRDDLVDAKELQKSKDHLIGGLILSLETSDELAAFYGGQEVLTRSILRPPDLIANIRKVKAEEVRAVARQLLRGHKLNLAIIGPYKNSSPFQKALQL